MDRIEEQIDDLYEEGITFKKIGYFFKKGWLRILIYMAISIVLALVVALPVRAFYKSEPVAQTTIEFIYSGIEKGLTPDGKPFDQASIITPTVLANAVDSSELSGKLSDISSLSNSVRVEGVETDEYVALVQAAANGDADAVNKLRNYKMYPTKYNIVISDPSALGLTDGEALTLLDRIVESYYDEFRIAYSKTKLFSSEMYSLSQNAETEFTDMYDQYTASLNSIKSYLTDLAAGNTSFGTEFNLLINELSVLNNSFNQFNAYIAANNVWRNPSRAKESLTKNKIDIESRLVPINSYIETLEKQIASIKPNTITSIDANNQPVTTEAYPAAYYEFHTALDNYNRQVLELNIQLASIKIRLDQFENASQGGEGHRLTAMQTITKLETEASTFVNKVNETIKDYYEASFTASAIRRVQPPIAVRRGLDFSVGLVIGIAAAIGLLIGALVTAIKIAIAKTHTQATKKNIEGKTSQDGADNND